MPKNAKKKVCIYSTTIQISKSLEVLNINKTSQELQKAALRVVGCQGVKVFFY
jgi:hypothetical protein